MDILAKRTAVVLCMTLSTSFSLLAEEKKTFRDNIDIVPFAFSNKIMGLSAGAAAVWKYAFQPQAAIFGAALASYNGTWLGVLSASNYTYSPQSRWLFGAQLYQGHFEQCT